MDSDNRYKALIQPIKDIAANWDIDIADSLTEYLEELDNLRISIDGGKSNLNFAEAALLIQGSTAVYSKKVEYLHQLVLQSLEFITSKKKTTTASGPKTAAAVEDDDLLIFDNDASFLLLDHVVEEGRNINLKAAPPNYVTTKNARTSNSFTSADNNTSRVSMSLMHSILNDDQGTASLKLSTSLVDPSGALLVCGGLPSSGANRMGTFSNRASLQNSFQEHSGIQQTNSFHADAAAASAVDGDYFDDHDNGGGGWDDGDDYAPTVPESDPAAGALAPSAAPGTPPRQTAATVPAAKAVTKKASAPFKDMFAQLDPHIVVAGSREARRGKTYKIPAALERVAPNPSALRVEHLYADVKKSHADTFCATGVLPAKGLFNAALLPVLQARRKQVRRERMLQMRQQRLLAGAEQREDGEAVPYQNLLLGGGAVAMNLSRHEELWSRDYADDGDDYGAAGGDFGDDGADGYEDGQLASAEAIGEFAPRRSLGGNEQAGVGFDDFQQETEEESLARRVAMVLNDELNQSTRTSYESICQKYIDNFNQGAHLFAKETQLSRRVAEWTQRLEPILQQQEEAAQFDIHAYCERLLEEVDEVVTAHQHEHQQEEDSDDEEEPEVVSFGEVAAGKPSGEVCRMFLACLQLINHGNISITPAAGVDQWTFSAPAATAIKDTARSSVEGPRSAATDPFMIKINPTKPSVAHTAADVENYLAPSLMDKQAKKSAMKGKGTKGKGSKRVHVDMGSNMLISV